MPAGRPSKLTPEVQQQFKILLEAGNFVETVCDYVGITGATFYNWMERGERGRKSDVDGGYVEFFDMVKKSVAIVEISTLRDLRAGPLNWQAKAWWLERRHPKKWGNRQQHQHGGPDDKPIQVEAKVTHGINGDDAVSIFDLLKAAGAFASEPDDAEAK